jgi:hypothetical protein
MAQVLQLTGGTEQVLLNAAAYDAAAIGAWSVPFQLLVGIVANAANTQQVMVTGFLPLANTVGPIALAANTQQVRVVQPEDFQIRQMMQVRLNTWYWLTQYETTPLQVTQQGYSLQIGVAYDRKVPGGGADPASGKIVQLEVPTVSGSPNFAAQVLPFPSISVGG